MKYRLSYVFAAITALFLSACVDDYFDKYESIPDGEASISATVSFKAADEAALGNTRTPGNAIKNINSLCVFVYNSDEELVATYTENELIDYKPEEDNTTHPSDAVDDTKIDPDGGDDEENKKEHQAETSTPKVSFKIPNLPFGKYYIYAVANMGDLSANPDYQEAIKTPDGLKNISLEWNTDVVSNNQMFGYFAPTDNESRGFDAPLLTFKNPHEQVYAWIKRSVSKVTVAYDGSGLRNSVYVYVKNVTIHDIPKECSIGAENSPQSAELLLNRKTSNNPGEDITPLQNTRFYYNSKGEIIDEEAQGDNPVTDWLAVYNGLMESNGKPKIVGSDHGENAQSLFFFENMQGDYDGQAKYNKVQQVDGDDKVGNNIREEKDGNDYKDRVPYGTYIEVDAYYRSDNPENISRGNIKYRFMLGKNITYNYDAQRNYHFKLTLGFKGWANQPDWHIDYEEPDPGIEVPDTFRVSYMYHEKSMMPIKLSGNCTNMTVEITENNWAPYDPTATDGSEVPQAIVPSSPVLYEFKWNRAAYFDSKLSGKEKPYLGFLALQMPSNYTDQTAIPINESTGYVYDFQSRGEAQTALKNDYETKHQNIRTFGYSQLEIKDGAYESGSPNEYYVNKVPDDANQRTVMLPLWTRARTMIEGSGFSGNNPYEYYERKAVLKIKADFLVNNPDGTTKTEHREKEVVVLQVPRIVNPKGVWKSATSADKTFRVRLKQAETSNSMSDFYDFKSQGEWQAYIDAGDVVELSKSDGTVGEIADGVINGRTGTEIDFNIDFKGSTGYAIVTVKYHGNNCVHKIFVRKGFDDMVNMGGNDWSSFSLYGTKPYGANGDANRQYTAILTKNPLALGSYFRRGRLEDAILVQNNNGQEYSGFSPLGAPSGRAFIIYNRNNPGTKLTKSWNNIGCDDERKTSKSMGTFYSEDGSIEYKVPTLDDFKALVNAQTQFGYGVLYGEGATEPADKAEVAYRMFDVDNKISSSPNGMRGVIVYDAEDGEQIFFPVAAYGMGRRQMFNLPKLANGNPNTNYYGTLRYADVYDVLTGSKDTDRTATGSLNNNCFRPVPYNLPIVSGAIYWIDEWVSDGHIEAGKVYPSMGWDINYFNYDFNAYTQNNYRDACVIKLIRKK